MEKTLEADPKTANWHAEPAEQVLDSVESRMEGLTDEEVRQRIDQWGRNVLPEPPRKGPLKRFLLQFHNVLIYVLIVAAGVTALLQHWLDTWVILGVVVVNAIIGFVQEGKAERALDAIRKMLSHEALVRRNGQRKSVPAEDLVRGDIVFLQSGDKVPADLRLIESKNLQIEEAVLTGESVAVEKTPQPVEREAVIGDRTCMAFSGTFVSYGQGIGVVTATGADTEIGRINRMLAEVEELTTPLLRQIAGFGRMLTVGILGIGLITFLVGFLLRGYEFAEIFLAVVGLAVAAIPEGLPAIITITLAIGVQRMAARQSIIRRLPAVETLGSVSVICSDKTGTLTRNEMMVRSVAIAGRSFEVSGAGYAPSGDILSGDKPVDPEKDSLLMELIRAGLLCNDATLRREEESEWNVDGDPTEGALVTLAMKASLAPGEMAKDYPRTDAIPFESEHRFMATLHHNHAGHAYVYLKGAPERVLGMCSKQRTDNGDSKIDPEAWRKVFHDIAAQGQRVLALAVRYVPSDKHELDFHDVESGMVFLGVVGIMDPPREEAIAAVKECHAGGIRVKMITGDHALTAVSIATQLGIGDGKTVLTGEELEKMNEEELAERAPEVDVFARTSPEHKLRLVRALQARNQIVAMTGDGVNDAPALKQSNVGVAMGIKGTEVSKQASEMVLVDDNFASITAAVKEGRTVYDNIKKAILFILPTNGGQAFTIIAAIALGMTLPITPVQILWVNMITAVTLALALAFEPMEKGVMQRPPRRTNQPLLSAFGLWRIAFVSLLLVGTTFGFFTWEYARESSIELARATAVNALVVGQIFYLFSSRFILEPSLNRRGLFGSRYILGAIALIILFQLAFTYLPPVQTLFGTEGLAPATWGKLAVAGLLILFLVEIEKAFFRRAGLAVDRI